MQVLEQMRIRIEYLDIIVLISHINPMGERRRIKHQDLAGRLIGKERERLDPVFFLHDARKRTVAVAHPDSLVGCDAERGVRQMLRMGEDAAGRVGLVIADQVSVHQQPQPVLLIELEQRDALVGRQG